jgi:hypothetical protein
MTNKCYSIDEECYNMTGLDEVIDALSSDDNLVVGHSYWEADAEQMTSENAINSTLHQLLDCFDESAYEVIGDAYDNQFSAVSEDAKAELKKLLTDWSDKHIKLSRYYLVKNSVEKFITEEDISE